jgi:hypothetical protein
MFKDNRTALRRDRGAQAIKIAAHAPKMPKFTQRASFYSHINPIWWQTLTNSPSPLILSTGTARRSCRSLDFFEKTTANALEMDCIAIDTRVNE